MAKYVQTTRPRKILGAYGRAAAALNALQEAGEELTLHDWEQSLIGLTAGLTYDPTTRRWTVTTE